MLNNVINKKIIKIGYDIEGGDGNPFHALEGLKIFLNSNNKIFIKVYLTKTFSFIDELKQMKNIELIYAEEVIKHEDSILEIRRKKKSTLIVAMNDLNDGKIDGLISAAPSGPLVTAGYLTLKTLSKEIRPAFSATIIGFDDKIRFLLDVGASIDSTVEQLMSFAYMGNEYFKIVHNEKNPKIGLLNIGKENKKGTETYKKLNSLLEKSDLNFIGNIEPNCVLKEDYDILLMDGFNGNILLKSYEGAFRALKDLMKEMSSNSKKVKLGLAIAKPLYDKFDSFTKNESVGAAIVLGLTKPLIKVHGSADEQQFSASFKIIQRVIENNLIDQLKENIGNASQKDNQKVEDE